MANQKERSVVPREEAVEHLIAQYEIDRVRDRKRIQNLEKEVKPASYARARPK